MTREVPFYSNASDNLRCLPACLRMALHAIEGRDPGAQVCEALAGFCAGHPTWNFRAYRTCAQRARVHVIDPTDFIRFSEDPLGLLTETFGPEDAAHLAQKADLAQAARDAGELCAPTPNLTLECRIPTPEDLEMQLQQENLVLCGVDLRVLNGRAPGADHGVLCLNISEREVLLHDPGLPPWPFRRVPRDRFIAAWSTPNLEARWLMSLNTLEHL